jgi:hypothetical protein
MIELNNYVLMVTCYIDKPFSLIQKGIENFQTSLTHSNLEIPTEVTEINIRSRQCF